MKKLGWYAVSAAVAALILSGGLMLAANLYVQSRVVQLRIRQALSASLRMPVTLKKTTFTPWDGLRIDGVAARLSRKLGPISHIENPPNELIAHSFRVHFAWIGLLRRNFRVDDVLLDHPQLSWAQDSDNRWRIPSEKLTDSAKRDREKSPPTDPATATTEIVSDAPTVPPAENPPVAPLITPDSVAKTAAKLDPPSAPGRRINVNKFRLRHGSMEFMNYRRGLLGRFENVNVNGRLTGSDQAVGWATFEKASLPRAGVKLARFRSDFAYDRQAGLTLSNATASLANGTVNANCHVATGEPGTPYDLKCRLENVSIDYLIKDAGGSRGLFQGLLQGTLDARGSTDAPERSDATGEMSLIDARIRELPLLQTIGSLLQIEDLQHLQFKTARLAYHIEGTNIQIQPLVLVSNNLQITAEGKYYAKEDRLDLHARLVIDQAVSRQLPRVVEQQFSPALDGTSGARYIEFDVTGPINKPNSNLYQRLLPNALDSLLGNLLRRPPKRAKEKMPRPSKPASPTPGNVDL